MDFSFVDTIFDPLQGKTVKRWVLELPGAGCEWYKKTGGCTMCAFNQSTQKYTFGGRLYPHFIFMLIFYYAYWLIRKKEPEILVIYNGGSFLNKKEIPLKTQLAILKFVKNHPTIKKVLVESRADLVTTERLWQYKRTIGENKKVEIAIGLESADDDVRNQCLNKGLSNQTFQKAVNICRFSGFDTFVYVYLKPHCLTEEEAINDAINSIEYCFDLGVTEVSLSCAFVQKNTLLEQLYNQGEFQPPTLWSIIKVIEQTAKLGPVRIGHFDDTPPPIASPKNCPACNDQVMQAIEKYRQSHDVSVFAGLTCECKPK